MIVFGKKECIFHCCSVTLCSFCHCFGCSFPLGFWTQCLLICWIWSGNLISGGAEMYLMALPAPAPQLPCSCTWEMQLSALLLESSVMLVKKTCYEARCSGPWLWSVLHSAEFLPSCQRPRWCLQTPGVDGQMLGKHLICRLWGSVWDSNKRNPWVQFAFFVTALMVIGLVCCDLVILHGLSNVMWSDTSHHVICHGMPCNMVTGHGHHVSVWSKASYAPALAIMQSDHSSWIPMWSDHWS